MLRFFIFIFLLPVIGNAQLQVARIFSGNMLLQRDQPIPVWGKALPGELVEVSLGATKQSVKATIDSSWIVYLPKQKANTHPQSLLVSSGDTAVQFNHILIGDIWLCIGQSNLEWPMMKEMHSKEEIKNSNQPLLRFYNPTYAGKDIFGTTFTDSIVQRLTPEKFFTGQWQPCDSNSFQKMSAVGYYFGKEVVQNIDVPIGLINLAIGGAPLETFIEKTALKNSRQFAPKVSGDWLLNHALPVWVRERGRQNIESLRFVPADENGKNHAYKPGFVWEAGIRPLLMMPLKGVLCYQGESNAQEMERVNEYAALSELMINEYRRKWMEPKLPFYYVQLSSIDTVKYKGNFWPQFRDEQRKMMQLIPYSGMVVCSDIGAKDDVHPTNKKEVGMRLARWALNKTYGVNILPSGPLPLVAKYSDGKVIVSFQHRAKGLMTSDGKSLKGFSIDGKNDMDAYIGDEGVIVPVGERPEFIYYGWKPFSDGNLVNSEKLPASTFKINVQ